MREPASDFIQWSALINMCTAGNDVTVRERSHSIVEGENWKRQIFFFKLMRLYNPFSKENSMYKQRRTD